MKKPTLREKVQKYEEFLHMINTFAMITMDGKKVSKLINNACRWSYAHRQGNGELSYRLQNDLIKEAFYKLTDYEEK